MLTMDPAVRDRLDGTVRGHQGWTKWLPGPLDGELRDGPATNRLKIDNSNPYSMDVGPLIPKLAKLGKRWKFVSGAGKVLTPEEPEQYRAVHVFTVIMRVIDFFEGKHGVGRSIPWAFPGELVVKINQISGNPNSRYIRRKKRGEIVFQSLREDQKIVWSTDSPDIVAHEATHAILDGLAPFLYTSPYAEARAIHEGVADLSAFFLSFQMSDLRQHLLESNNFNLKAADVFMQIAEQYGEATSTTGDSYLRTLDHSMKIEDVDPPGHPYKLASVLTAFIIDVICDEQVAVYKRITSTEDYGKSNKSDDYWRMRSILEAPWKVQKVLYRALDYLPPGDVGFEMLIASMIEADEAMFPNPEHAGLREFIRKRAKERGIIPSETMGLKYKIEDRNLFKNLTLSHLTDGTFNLGKWANQNRANLRVPSEAEIGYLVAYKSIKEHRQIKNGQTQKELKKELILKIAWQHSDSDSEDIMSEKRRSFSVHGTTVVVNWRTKAIKFASTSNFEADKLFGKKVLASPTIALRPCGSIS